MKNITYDNLIFLSEMIKNDIKIKNARSNTGFAHTKVNDIEQTRDLNFKSKAIPLCGEPKYYEIDRNNKANRSTYQILEYNNKIHFFGSGGYSRHSKVWHWMYDVDKCEVTYLNNLPANVENTYGSCAVITILNNKIHFISQYSKKHYIYNDDDTWEEINDTTLSTILTTSGNTWIYGLTYNNDIHMFIHINGTTSTKHYSWDGASWTELDDLPFYYAYSGTVSFIWNGIIVYKNKIHFPYVIEKDNSSVKAHYTWDKVNGCNKIFTYDSSNITNNNNKTFIFNDYLTIYTSDNKFYFWDDTDLITFMGNSYSSNLEYVGCGTTSIIYFNYFSYKGNSYILAGYPSTRFTIARWAGGNWLLTKPVYYLDSN